MSLEIYDQNNIRNALQAALVAIDTTTDAIQNGGDPFIDGFTSGYRAAITTIAVAFGLAAIPADPQKQPTWPVRILELDHQIATR